MPNKNTILHATRILKAVNAGCNSQETICEYARMDSRTLQKTRKVSKIVDEALHNLDNQCSRAYRNKLKKKVVEVKKLVASGKSIRSSCIALSLNPKIYYKYKDHV